MLAYVVFGFPTDNTEPVHCDRLKKVSRPNPDTLWTNRPGILAKMQLGKRGLQGPSVISYVLQAQALRKTIKQCYVVTKSLASTPQEPIHAVPAVNTPLQG